MIANLARKNNSITSDVFINNSEASKPSADRDDKVVSIGLSYCAYFKKNTDRLTQFEYSKNGSFVRLASDEIDPYIRESHDRLKNQRRGIIDGFSKASQRRFKSFTSKIDQAMISSDEVLFITLTAPSENWENVSWEQWKVRLNNFNTQLRQKFKGTDMCGVWRMEFQSRGALHYHICLFKVSYLDHEWVAKTWNNICCKKTNMSAKSIRDHRNSSTSVELARDWRAVGTYFNKTLAYLGKDIISVLDPKMRDEIKRFGRHWGYINKKNIDKLTNIIKGDFQTEDQYFKMRRWTRKLVNSKQRMKYDKIKKSSDRIKYKKDKNGDIIYKDGKVVKIKVAECNKHHTLSKKLKKLYNAKQTKVSAFISDQTFKKMLALADVDVDKSINDSKNRWEIEQEKRKLKQIQ